MPAYNEDAWELVSEWLDRHPEIRPASTWLPQPEPCDSLFNAVKKLHPGQISATQSFRPFYNTLKSKGFKLIDNVPAKTSLVLCVPTRQKIESLGLIAQSVLNLADDGFFVLACANAQGSSSYLSKIKSAVSEIESESGNKCKLVAFRKNQVSDVAALQEWLTAAGPTRVEGSDFESIPGIYGWNKIDRGSELLVSTLPALSGTGADFGAGYGYLSQAILKTGSPEKIHLVEADQRALSCAQRNLAQRSSQCAFHWSDIVGAPSELSAIADLDWIVMNPPFHEGRDTEMKLGKIFIEKAAAKLKAGGRLFIVANGFLPYEDLLQAKFKTARRVLASDGFKVIHAEL